MQEVEVYISSHFSKPVDELPKITFDYGVTVCDAAKESCPYFPGGKIIHMGFQDSPALTRSITNEEEILSIYRRGRDEIEAAIKKLK